MKSLVKLILSVGIKLAFVALLFAIVMGLSSCSGCTPSDTSFSLAINQNPDVTEESVKENISDPVETTVSSLKANETGSNTTGNNMVAKPTEQTSQEPRNTESASNNQEGNDPESNQHRSQQMCPVNQLLPHRFRLPLRSRRRHRLPNRQIRLFQQQLQLLNLQPLRHRNLLRHLSLL